MSLKNFNLLLPGSANFSTPYQCLLIKKGCSSVPPPHPPWPYPRLCLFPSLISIRTKQAYSKADNSRIYQYRNAVSLQIFTRNVKKEKVALSISHNKRIVNKYSNENSNKEERYDWIRILNKLHWLKMQVMLTFFYLKQLFEIFICNLLSTFSSFQCLYIVRFEFFLVHMMDQISTDTSCDLTEKVLLRF